MKIKHPLLLRIFLSLIVLSIMSVLLVLGSRSVLKSLYPLRYTEFVETYAEENNLIMRIGKRVLVDRIRFDRLCDCRKK